MTATKAKLAFEAEELTRLARRAAVNEEHIKWLIANVGAGGGARAALYVERLEKADLPPPFSQNDRVRHIESLRTGQVLSWNDRTDEGRILYDTDGKEAVVPAGLLEKI